MPIGTSAWQERILRRVVDNFTAVELGKISSENMYISRRIMDIKHRNDPLYGSSRHNHSSEESDALQKLREMRRNEESRIKNENMQLAKRLAELKAVNAKDSVAKEIERYKATRSKHREQVDSQQPAKVSKIRLIQRSRSLIFLQSLFTECIN